MSQRKSIVEEKNKQAYWMIQHMLSKCAALLPLWLAATLSASAQGLARDGMSRESMRDSLRQAIETLAYHPDSVDLMLRKASWNLQLEQWQYAKDEYDKVLRIDPTNVAALFYRAYANDRLLRYKFARIDYEALLGIVPGNFEAQLGLALVNQKDKHFTEAMDGINRLVTAFPDSAVAWAARAGMESERGQLELAEYDYSEALRRDPDNEDYLLNRADLRIKLKRKDDARYDLDTIVKRGTPKMALKEWYDKCK